jgi:hypothetical protein
VAATNYHAPVSVRRLYLVGSIAAFAYAGAQVFQWALLLVTGPPPSAAAALQARLSSLDVARAFVVWLSFWALPITFYALYTRLIAKRPGWARLGLGASMFFVSSELFYRTIDLFVVTQHWTVRWAGATGPARAALAERIAVWDELVLGWYVMLLTAHFIGLAAFACAIDRRGAWLDRVAWLSLAAYAGVTGMRLVAYPVSALEPICTQLYFPTAVACFASAGGLLCAASRDRSPEPGREVWLAAANAWKDGP